MILKPATTVFATLLRCLCLPCRVHHTDRRRVRPLALAIVPFAALGCVVGLAESPIDVIPVPKQALAMRRILLNPDGAGQVSFQVHQAYPSTVVLDFYDRHFQDRGWARCDGRQPGWTTFMQGGDEQEVRIHRMRAYWVSESEKMIALGVVQYRSPWTGHFGGPENDLQHVTIVIMWGLDTLGDALEVLEVTCSPHVTVR